MLRPSHLRTRLNVAGEIVARLPCRLGNLSGRAWRGRTRHSVGMRFDERAVEEFRALYENEFGEALSFDEAQLRATEIVNLYACLLDRGASSHSATPPDAAREEP